MDLTPTPVPVASLDRAREAHFARLGEGPELYLELLLRKANAYRLDWGGQPAGYCVRTEDGLLAELELERPAWAAQSEIFAEVADRLDLRGARCFSFDSLLLGLCVERGWVATVDGRLFRDLLDERGPAGHENLTLRPAMPADVDCILPHREGVFESEDECREWVARGHVSVLERDTTFLGIGLVTRVWPERPEHDVGVMIHPEPSRPGIRLVHPQGAQAALPRLRRSADRGLRSKERRVDACASPRWLRKPALTPDFPSISHVSGGRPPGGGLIAVDQHRRLPFGLLPALIQIEGDPLVGHEPPHEAPVGLVVLHAALT